MNIDNLDLTSIKKNKL